MDARTTEALELMMRFADRTGLTSDRPGRRYLWTDAFAVCAFLGLDAAIPGAGGKELALRLIDRVHQDLGRHRADDRRRRGWISGLSEAEGLAHPTCGGLRIGKPLPERDPAERLDPEREWDRDGQYFHYLTKWMHALDQAARATGEPELSRWARELARTAHDAFTYGPPGNRRMVWKLSVDLSRPLVPSMGQHDPLDGLVTCRQLEATAAALPRAPGPSLTSIAADFARMVDRGGLATTDPLGLGGLLVDACRLVQLDAEPELVAALLDAARVGLERYATGAELRAPAELRLAFRELGLAIGLAGVVILQGGTARRRLGAASAAILSEVARFLPLRGEIEAFWLRPHSRRTSTWAEHADINDVMLATSLAPEGFLSLGSPRANAPRVQPAAKEG